MSGSLRRPRVFVLFLIVVSLGVSPGLAAPAAPPHTTAPRLVVLFVVDQMRADYLDRFRARFGPDGFRQLLAGARFTECAYPYAITETAPGHATLATGTTPDRHGIVGNEWYDRALGRMVTSVEDPAAPLVGASGTGASPRRLLADTLGDGMRLATGGRALTFAVAGKDRAAILSVGAMASGAYWYDEGSGRMVTSNYFRDSLPAWASRFDASHYAGKRTADDFRRQPAFHDMLLDFAASLVEGEHLGEDDDPDLLVVGLSGVDFLGHHVGPYDHALEEMLVRLDGQIADFLRRLDMRIGRDRLIVALSADHGVSPTHAQVGAAGRRADDAPVLLERRRIESVLSQALVRRAGDRPAPRLLGDSATRFWLDPGDLQRASLSLEAAVSAAGDAALAIPGILGYVSRDAASVDPLTAELYRKSLFAGRSPDLLLVPLPYALEGSEEPASHGTPWAYDRRVPLLLTGAPFRPGLYREPCSPADLAPTLAAALRIPPPSMTSGRTLAEALR
jgi:predicted AlkP superfamily pyrophosphatase or phosphodiesterase